MNQESLSAQILIFDLVLRFSIWGFCWNSVIGLILKITQIGLSSVTLSSEYGAIVKFSLELANKPLSLRHQFEKTQYYPRPDMSLVRALYT